MLFFAFEADFEHILIFSNPLSCFISAIVLSCSCPPQMRKPLFRHGTFGQIQENIPDGQRIGIRLPAAIRFEMIFNTLPNFLDFLLTA